MRRRLDTARQPPRGAAGAGAVTPDLEARGDTSGALALGARAYELATAHDELARAARGTPIASPLFVGHDGIPYKRAYAAIGAPGDVAGFVAVEGNADYPATLAAFRRSLVLAGLGALAVVLALTVWRWRAGSRAR